ncbi:hypothetical protein DFH07DRAFT_782780 [Mycena maculata]|uniref:Uncharacterized protein n=1 Tax=Mycena maculata TaxID=230809 RepID=A0AAD7MPF1_9AGAR|nr:hypothetical protein DFH07DRAFT_782780 [Mycena maculata]
MPSLHLQPLFGKLLDLMRCSPSKIILRVPAPIDANSGRAESPPIPSTLLDDADTGQELPPTFEQANEDVDINEHLHAVAFFPIWLSIAPDPYFGRYDRNVTMCIQYFGFPSFKNGILADDQVDLDLDLIKDENGKPECFYLADHRQRIIFWYVRSTFDAWCDSTRCTGPGPYITLKWNSLHNIGERFARYHCTLFPSILRVSRGLVCELRDTVAYSIGAQRRLYNFHSEPCTRLDKERSVFRNETTRSPILRILGPILFNAPLGHLRAWEDMLVFTLDLGIASWTAYVWNGRSLSFIGCSHNKATILDANVAFLSIPTFADGSHISARSTSQIASYISVFFSLGSIIFGLILVRQSRRRRDDEIDVVATFLGRHSPTIWSGVVGSAALPSICVPHVGQGAFNLRMGPLAGSWLSPLHYEACHTNETGKDPITALEAE